MFTPRRFAVVVSFLLLTAATVLGGAGPSDAAIAHVEAESLRHKGSCWSLLSWSSLSGGKGRTCMATNATLRWEVSVPKAQQGTLRLYGFRDSVVRSFRVRIDRRPWSTGALTGPTSPSALFHTSEPLSAGRHVVELEWVASAGALTFDFQELETGAVTSSTTAAPSTTTTTVAPTTPTTAPPTSAPTCNVDPADGETAIMAAIEGCPDGSTVLFPAGRSYTVGRKIEVKDRRDLTIDGNGSTFTSTADGTTTQAVNGVWVLLRGSNVTLKNMTSVGSFDVPGPRSLAKLTAPRFTEAAMGYGLYGVDGARLVDVKALRVWGDGVTTGPDTYVDGSTADYTRNVHIERMHVETTGRHCWAPTSGENITIQDSVCKDAWYGGLDAELDDVAQPLRGHRYLRNTFDGYFMFGAIVPVIGNNGTTADIEIRGNRFLTPADNVCNPIIQVGAYPDTNPNVADNVVVADNDIVVTQGVTIILDHVRGGSITGNTINLEDTAGCNWPNPVEPVKVTNSTNVTVSGNTIT